MKKIFYIPLVALAMAFATTSCDNADEPQMPGSSLHDNDVPENCEQVSFSLEFPEEAEPRSRAASSGWFGTPQEVDYLHFRIYRVENDGSKTLLYSSLTDNSYVTKSSIYDYSLKFTLPKGTSYEAYFVVDAYEEGSPESCFTFDWENGTIDVDHTKALGSLDMSDLFTGSQAFTLDFTNKTAEITVRLYRPQAQFSVTSPDTRKPDMIEAFPDGMRTYVYFKDADGNPCIPYRWHFDGTVDFKTLAEDEIFANTSMNLGLSTYSVKLNGEMYDYWFMGYYFAPKEVDTWETTCVNGIVPKSVVLKYGFEDGRIFNEVEITNMSKIAANRRLVITSLENSTIKDVVVNPTVEAGFSNGYFGVYIPLH